MSTEIYESKSGEVFVTVYAGPASLGADRRMVQITTANGKYIKMRHSEFVQMVKACGGAEAS